MAGDDHPRAVLLDVVVLAPVDGAGEPRLQHARIEDHQQRGRRHGQRHHGNEQARLRRFEQAEPCGKGDQHEGKFAALRQREGEARGIGRGHAEQPPQHEQHCELHHDEAHDQPEDEQRLAEQQREVDAGTDRDEEHREQQALEGLEVHFKLVAVFAFGQHHAGKEGAECRREAHQLHEQRDADHQHQRKAHEDLAHAGFRHQTEQRTGKKAADQNNRCNGGEHGEGLRPARQVADQRCVMRVMCLRRGEQGQEGEDGNDRDVLEQQHREGGLAGGGLEQAALVEALQHDGCRRHGEDEAGGHGRLPAEAQRQRSPADCQRGDGDLQATEPDDRAAQLPQLRGLQFEADEEQHDDDAEFGEMHHILAFLADEAEERGPDDHARHQIAQHRAEPEAGGDGGGDHGSGEIDEGAEEEVLRVHRWMPSAKAGGRVKSGARCCRGSMVPSRRPTIRSR